MDSTEFNYLRNLAVKERNWNKEKQAQAEVSQDAKGRVGLKEQGPQAVQRESLRILRIGRMYV